MTDRIEDVLDEIITEFYNNKSKLIEEKEKNERLENQIKTVSEQNEELYKRIESYHVIFQQNDEVLCKLNTLHNEVTELLKVAKSNIKSEEDSNKLRIMQLHTTSLESEIDQLRLEQQHLKQENQRLKKELTSHQFSY